MKVSQCKVMVNWGVEVKLLVFLKAALDTDELASHSVPLPLGKVSWYSVKLRPDYSGSCSCSVSCASSNVDGFASPSPSGAINRSHVLERFATVSVELSVHTGNIQPEPLQHEQSGCT
jgi:hypothetical protein